MEHNHIQIRAALIIDRKADLTPDGFNAEFTDKLTTTADEIRSKIIIPINEIGGVQEWAVEFIEASKSPPIFHCNIYVNDNGYYRSVAEFIKSRIVDVDFEFFPMGTIADYLQ